MRKSTSSLFLLPLLFLLAVSVRPCYSDTVTMSFTGTGSANEGGYYIYPYYFDIQNGSTTARNVALMCISFIKEIAVPESWISNVQTAASLNDIRYEEAAYLVNLAATNPGQAGAAQWAAWYLFDNNLSKTINNFDITGLLADANNNAGQYGSYLIDLPVDGTESRPDLGTPQTFVGTPAVPEPGSFVLLATALLGLAAMLYYQKRGFLPDVRN